MYVLDLHSDYELRDMTALKCRSLGPHLVNTIMDMCDLAGKWPTVHGIQRRECWISAM